MDRLLYSVTAGVALLLAALSPPAAAEYFPPPTIEELLKADYVAVGHFVEKDGDIRFVPARALWGRAEVVDELRKDECSPVRVEDNGQLIAWIWSDRSVNGSYPEDATRQAVWFFFRERGPGDLAAQPVELASDFTALRSGKKASTLFHVLQRLDFDMRRAAEEELFASGAADMVAALHEIALNQDSLAALDAVDALIRTRRLNADRFWGRWVEHPARYELQPLLRRRDARRVMQDLRKAVAAEARPPQLADLLYYAREDDVLNIQYLGHGAEEVRGRALGNLRSRLRGLARQPGKSSEAQALAERLLPLLRARRKIERGAGVRRSLDKMLEEKDGVPWVLRVPTTDKPPPPYSEAEERKFVVSRLTSYGQHGFVMESAGREITEHFFAEGFEQLKAAAASSNFNGRTVFEGMGYVRHPRVFAYLVEHAKYSGAWHAIGRQNHERSFDVLKELIESRVTVAGGSAARSACDALGYLRDPRALALLKELEGALGKGNGIAYLRARLAHGDSTALPKLLAMPHEESGHSDGVIRALLLTNAPDATEALKRQVRNAWPTRWESFLDGSDLWWCMRMQNYAGNARRTTALGEVARRDPRWLAALALKRMESPLLSARVCGAYIFRGLTARSFGFRPEAFASERAPPLKALRDWWEQHASETREQWLLSYFRQTGFRLERLHAKESLPVLVDALAADELTHGLAVEQISVITGKYFGNYAQPALKDGYGTRYTGGGGYEQMDQKRTTIRVIGWLATRNLVPARR